MAVVGSKSNLFPYTPMSDGSTCDKFNKKDIQYLVRNAAEDICSLFYSCRLNECIKNGNDYDLCKKFGECKHHAIDEVIKIISRHFVEGEECE